MVPPFVFLCFDCTKRETPPRVGERARAPRQPAGSRLPSFVALIFGAPTEEGFEDLQLLVD